MQVKVNRGNSGYRIIVEFEFVIVVNADVL